MISNRPTLKSEICKIAEEVYSNDPKINLNFGEVILKLRFKDKKVTSFVETTSITNKIN